MDTTTLIVIAVILVALIAVGIVLTNRRRSEKLRSQFGPEYDRAVKETGDKSKAEAELQKREKRVEKLEIRPLDPAQRDRFAADWKRVQAEFVDSPESAIRDADILLQQAMKARGYPVENFEQVAADVSVDHPTVVEHFRKGHDIAVRHRHGEGTTEDLRQAMVNYRALFEELVNDRRPADRGERPTANRELHSAEDHR